MKRMELRKAKQHFWQNTALAVGLFTVCFLLFSTMRNQAYFMDEMDNFYIGLQMTKGAVLYDTIFSQHMPLMYYICAGFARLGAHTVLEFRMCWYVLLSLCYVLLFLRYHKWVGRVPLLLWPIFYLLAITNTALCSAILAEQLQAVGMVMLLLEFWQFTKTKQVLPASALCIALGINLSFLSAFVAAFGCAVIVLGYLVFEGMHCVKQKLTFGNAIGRLWKKYRLTIGVTLLPMVAFALLFAWQGNLDDFIYKAYTLNREIYSKYQGGFGESPWQAALGCVVGLIDFGKLTLQTLFQGAANTSLASIVLFLAQGVFLLWLCVKRQWFAAVTIGVFFLLCGSRGFYNFHALQIFAISALALALLLGAAWRTARNSASGLKKAFFFTLVCAVGIGFIGLSGGPVWEKRTSLYPTKQEWAPVAYEAHSYERLIHTLTEPEEYILENINSEDLFLHTHARAPVYNTACSPWWWEGTKERSMAEITKSPPRIAVFDPEYATWGYKVKDFAPEMTAFIEENYTVLYDDAPFLWVRNEYLAEARDKLPQNDESMVPCTVANRTCGDTLPVRLVQSFTATRAHITSIALQFGTHGRPYTGTVTVTLAAQSGETLATWQLQGKEILDNRFTPVHTSNEAPLAVTVGQRYTLTLVLQHKSDDNLTLWASENEGTVQSNVTVNGEKQAYNLRIKVR